MGSIEQRLRRLEGMVRQCPECGWPPAPGEEIELDIYWEDLDGGPEPPLEPDCSTCGKPGETVITWTDLGEDYYGGDVRSW